MRKPMVAGNWKMNKTSAQGVLFVQELSQSILPYEHVEKVICPPYLAIPAISALLKDQPIGVGVQDVYSAPSGAFTGEVSVDMVKEFCQYVIIGHSERRALFGETDKGVNQKVQAALAGGLTTIICAGETLAENEAGQTQAVVSRQVTQALIGVESSSMAKVVIAYEPVWAIGTGKAASAEGANRVIKECIRDIVAGLYNPSVADELRILYGGSVNGANAEEFFSQKDIDGALVGGASLKTPDFTAIVAAASRRN